MRVKCDSLGIECEDYSSDQVVENIDTLFTGVCEHLVDDQVIDNLYKDESVFLDEEEVEVYPNQFVMLISNSNDKKTALAKFKNYETS